MGVNGYNVDEFKKERFGFKYNCYKQKVKYRNMNNPKNLNQSVLTTIFKQLYLYLYQSLPHRQSHLLKLCPTFGLPSSHLKTSKLISMVCFAVANLLLDQKHGLQLAAIFVKQFCRPKDYWDVIHFLDRVQISLKENIHSTDDVLEIVKIDRLKSEPYNIAIKFSCFCNFTSDVEFLRCYKCLSIYHPNCQNQSHICNRCHIFDSSLFHRPILTLFCGYLKACQRVTLIQFRAPDVQTAKTATTFQDTYLVEMRIQKLIGVGYDEKVTKYFNFYLNHQILNFKSDEGQIKLPLRYLEEENVMAIETKNFNAQKPSNIVYMVGIYKVVPKMLNKDHIVHNLPRLPEEKLCQFYSKINNFEKTATTSIICGRREKNIILPCRSYLCRHFQCFDFFEVFDKNAKMSKGKRQKKMNCPICQIKIQSIYVDSILEKYLIHKVKEGKDYESVVISFDETNSVKCISAIENIE